MPGERVLHTPAGKCPVKLEGSSLEEVRDWSNLVIEKGRQNNLIYLPSALLYFSQQFYSIFTQEYKEIKQHIIQIFNFNVSEENLFISTQKENIKKENEQAAADKREAENNSKKKDASLKVFDPTIKKKRGRPPKNK